MKTTIEKVIAVIGHEVGTKITGGRYGDTSLTSGGYLRGDPCYWMKDKDYEDFRNAAIEQAQDAYGGRDRDWHQITFRGQPAFFRSCGDGISMFNHCVDSGWVAAIKGKFTPDGVCLETETRDETPA